MTRHRWTLRVVAAAFWLGALALSVSTYTVTNDHFDRISRARQIARYGAVPFRDFFDPGYFMTELSTAWLQRLCGDNLLGEMLLDTVFIASGVTIVFVLARRVAGSYLGGLTAAVLALLSMPRAYDFDKVLFYPLGIALCWRYIDRPGARRALELAAGLAIGALFRYDTGVYIGLAAVVTMLVSHWREPALFARRISLCAGAAALCGLAALLPIVGFAGVRDAIDQVVTYAVREKARTEVGQAPRFTLGSLVGRASVPPPVASVVIRWSRAIDDADRIEAESRYRLGEGVLKDTSEDRTYRYTMKEPTPTVIGDLIRDPRVDDTAGVDRGRQSLPEERLWIRAQRLLPPLQWRILPDAWTSGNATAFLYYFLWGLPFVGVIGMAAARRLPWSTTEEVARLGSVVVVCLALNVFVLREPIGARIGGIAGPVVILATWVGARAWQARPLRLRLALSTGVLVVFALVVSSLANLAAWSEQLGPEIASRSHVRGVVAGVTSSPPRPEMIAGGPFVGMVRYLRECTHPNDRVLARWFIPELYFFAQRGFAAGMVVTFGGHWSEPRFQSRSLQAMESESVPIIIALAGDEKVLDEYPVLTRYIDEHYTVAGRTNFDGPDADGKYVVLVRKDRLPTRTDSRTSLPCFD